MSGYSEMKEVIPGQEVHAPPYAPPIPNPGYQQQYGGGYPVLVDNTPHVSGGDSAGTTTTCWGSADDGKTPPEDEKDYENSLIPEKYLNLEFDSCFQEHKSTKTIPFVYKVNGYVFKYTKLFFYNLFVIVFGILFSFIWAMILGILSFVLTWMWNPALKASILVISRTLPAVTEPLKALFTPLVDVQARLFRQIRVRSWLEGGLMSPFSKREDHIA